MFTNNPFAALSASIPPAVMQTYIVVMIILVAAGTLFDVLHKGSAKYFFQNMRKAKGKARSRSAAANSCRSPSRPPSSTCSPPGEFCNPRRRIAHLLGMYGFVLYVARHRRDGVRRLGGRDLGAALVARRPDDLRRRLLVLVLHPRRRRRRGQLALAPRARGPVHPVAARQRDARPRLGLDAGLRRGRRHGVLFGLYILATTVLFGGVSWSKFAHMFFKPAAAFEKRVSEANGTNAESARR